MKMNHELFIELIEYPDYAIGDLANVLNIITNKILKSNLYSSGYRQVRLPAPNGVYKFAIVSRLVLSTFIPSPIDGQLYTCDQSRYLTLMVAKCIGVTRTQLNWAQLSL